MLHTIEVTKLYIIQADPRVLERIERQTDFPERRGRETGGDEPAEPGTGYWGAHRPAGY